MNRKNAPATSRKNNYFFQHDGAPKHIHNDVITFSNRQLPERWIGRGEGDPRPELHDLQI